MYRRRKTREILTTRPSSVVEIITYQPFIESMVNHSLDMSFDPNYDMLVEYENIHKHKNHFFIPKL